MEYLDMSSKNMNKKKIVDIQEKEENLATLKATQQLISEKTNIDERGVKLGGRTRAYS